MRENKITMVTSVWLVGLLSLVTLTSGQNERGPREVIVDMEHGEVKGQVRSEFIAKGLLSAGESSSSSL